MTSTYLNTYIREDLHEDLNIIFKTCGFDQSVAFGMRISNSHNKLEDLPTPIRNVIIAKYIRDCEETSKSYLEPDQEYLYYDHESNPTPENYCILFQAVYESVKCSVQECYEDAIDELLKPYIEEQQGRNSKRAVSMFEEWRATDYKSRVVDMGGFYAL